MIQKAEMEDLEGITSLLRMNLGAFSEIELGAADENIRKIMEKRGMGNDFFVAKESGKIVGCAGFEKQRDTEGVYSLNWLAVHPGFKRRGVATELYILVESRVKDSGGRLIFLNAGSGEANGQFYRKMGFRKTGRIPKYYNETKDMIFYCKQLSR